MFEPIDFTRIKAALVSPAGWWELAIVAACFAVGWVIDRRLNHTLWNSFRANGIRIPLPQRGFRVVAAPDAPGVALTARLAGPAT